MASDGVLPHYPVYIPSKGRADRVLTAKMFARDGVPFHLVVEPQEVEAYAKAWGAERVLSLPENDRGLVYARNWIKDHSRDVGEARHWQFDDDVKRMIRLTDGRRIPCDAGMALIVAEDLVDRYENVALASFNSWFFVPAVGGIAKQQYPPFYLNARCYTCFLVDNALPNRWRGRYNEDTDMTLQVLACGHCTILLNAFLIDTPETETAKGGQTDIYAQDGRLKMSRELERRWPGGVVKTYRRFGRPQHYVNWRKFDTLPRLKADPPAPRLTEADFKLTVIGEIKNASLRAYARRKGARGPKRS